MLNEISDEAVRSSDIIDKKVINTNRDKLGKIEDIVLSRLKLETKYAVLSFGGLLGMGTKFFAIPWSHLRFDSDEDAFMLDISKDKLDNAPGFDKDQWPDMAD